MRQDFARQMGQDPATFLRDEGDERADALLDSFRAQAHDRVITTLVLDEIIKAEQIEVTDEEVEADLEPLLAQLAAAPAAQRPDDEQLRSSARARLVRERTVERLEQIAVANHAAGLGGDDEDDADIDEESGESDDGAASAEAESEQPEASAEAAGDDAEPTSDDGGESKEA